MNKSIELFVLATIAVTVLASNAAAGEYDFEVGLSYGSTDTDTGSPLVLFGTEPGAGLGSRTSSSDSDRVQLTGSWYYTGLSDQGGPKSRAAFLDRASGVSLAYSYDDLSGSYEDTGLEDPLPPGILPRPPSSGSTDGTTHLLSASLRHVWKTSGWYGLASVTRIDSEIDTVSDDLIASFDTDGTAYAVGVGKYLGQATALDLSVISSDLDGFDTTAYALSFNHVGSLGKTWKYAADLGFAISDEDNADDSYSLGLSLFPTDELEFGIELLHQDGPFDGDRDTYGGLVSWFVRDHVKVHANYRNSEWEPNEVVDSDSDQFEIGVDVRF